MQYDVHRNLAGNADRVPFLVVLQHDHVEGLPTRIVAPVLGSRGETFPTRVTLDIEIAGETLTISMPELFSLPTKRLGPVVGNLASRHHDIVRSLDRLITGH
jgi:hypothetical protein